MTARKRILVVEDDHAIRAIETRILTASGFEVTAVEDGTSGLQAAKESRYDLLLLDVMMPGLNGFELARALGADPTTRDVPILFATALGDDKVMAEGFEAGASLYLVKPFTSSTLLTMVRAALANGRYRQARDG